MTHIDEIVALHEAGKNQYEIAALCGVTHQAIYRRLKTYYANLEASKELGGFVAGDIVYERQTGQSWEVVGPGYTPGSVRVSTDGGGNSMDLSFARISRKPPEGKPCEVATVFSVARGDDPKDPKFKAYIENAMRVRAHLDSMDKPRPYFDIPANLKATKNRRDRERAE